MKKCNFTESQIVFIFKQTEDKAFQRQKLAFATPKYLQDLSVPRLFSTPENAQLALNIAFFWFIEIILLPK